MEKQFNFETISVNVFNFNIQKIIRIDDSYLILYHIDNKQVMDDRRNVILINKAGTIVWQIGNNNSPYVNIYVENEQLMVNDWKGFTYFLSLEDGSVTPYMFTK